MIPRRGEIIGSVVGDLRAAAVALADVACELNGTASAIEAQSPETLRLQATGIQSEAARAALAALTVRGAAAALAVMARLEAPPD